MSAVAAQHRAVLQRVVGSLTDIAVLTRLAEALYPDAPRTAGDWERLMNAWGDDLSVTLAWFDGRPKGFSQSIRDRPNNILNVEIAVYDDNDATEIAAALHTEALPYQRAESLSRLQSSVLGEGVMARYWAAAGFEVVERFHRLSLRLPTSVSQAPVQIHIEELTATNTNLYAAHTLYCDGTRDQPGGGEPEDLASWTKRLDDGGHRLVGTVNGEGVGYASLRTTEARPTTAFHSLTTVAREHRGRGIRLALKAGVIDWAQDHGFTLLETASATENIRMRAINDALGFQPLPTVLVFEKTARPPT